MSFRSNREAAVVSVILLGITAGCTQYLPAVSHNTSVDSLSTSAPPAPLPPPATTELNAVQLMTRPHSVVGTGNFGSGQGDVLYQKLDETFRLFVINPNGDTFFITPEPVGWTAIGVGDFNGDGKSDILFRDRSGQLAIWLMNSLALSQGDAVQSQNGTLAQLYDWKVLELRDFNQDGKTDLVLRQEGSGLYGYWAMDGRTILSTSLTAPPPAMNPTAPGGPTNTVINRSKFRRVGYLADYYLGSQPDLLDRIDFSKLTHIAVIRGDLGSRGRTEDFEKLIFRAHQKGVSVLLSIPADDNSDVSPLGDTSAFAAKIITEVVDRYGFDGVDLDFEFETKKERYANYPQLVSHLRSMLTARGKLLSAAVTYRYLYLPNEIKSSLSQFDFVNIMSYDNEVLYSPSQFNVLSTAVQEWGSSGVPRDRQVFGLSFYAQAGAEAKSHRQLVLEAGDRFNYAANEVGWINPTYAEIMKKTEFINDVGAGGVMIWELSYDFHGSDQNYPSLTDAVWRAYLNTSYSLRVWLGSTYMGQAGTLFWKNASGNASREWVGIYRADTGAYTGHYFSLDKAEGSTALPSNLEKGVPYEVRAFCCEFRTDQQWSIFSRFKYY